MALKITTQIGTDKGITSEAYVRISEYQVSKYGSAIFKIEVFQSESEKESFNVYKSPLQSNSSRNQQIGESLFVSLMVSEEATRTVNKAVSVTYPAIGVEGKDGYVPEHTEVENQDVVETYQISVPDLSPFESGTIFEFAYTKLKEKLVGLFGAEHVIDC